MKIRYCPNCKRTVGTRMTGGQIACTLVLLFVFFPALALYVPLHARKCPYCGAKTIKYIGKEPIIHA